MNHTNAQWVATSRERPRTEFKGTGSGTNKEILSNVKAKLNNYIDSKKAKNGETFKVSIIGKEGNVVDAWNVKAKVIQVATRKTTKVPSTKKRTTTAKVATKRTSKK